MVGCTGTNILEYLHSSFSFWSKDFSNTYQFSEYPQHGGSDLLQNSGIFEFLATLVKILNSEKCILLSAIRESTVIVENGLVLVQVSISMVKVEPD